MEELVLTGYADLLLGRNHEVEDADSIGFLEVLPQYQVGFKKIQESLKSSRLIGFEGSYHRIIKNKVTIQKNF